MMSEFMEGSRGIVVLSARQQNLTERLQHREVSYGCVLADAYACDTSSAWLYAKICVCLNVGCMDVGCDSLALIRWSNAIKCCQQVWKSVTTSSHHVW